GVQSPGHARPQPPHPFARPPASSVRYRGRRRRAGAASRRQRGLTTRFSRSPTMEPNSERTPPEPTRPPQPPAPRKRFRIRKLEERIAPKHTPPTRNGAIGDTFCCTNTSDTAACY